MYIDENCFWPLKMEELFAIAVSFVKKVRNRGFTPVKVIGCLRSYILELVCCENNRVEVEEVCVDSLQNSVVFLSITR